MSVAIESTNLASDFNVNELTSGELNGSGVLDALITTAKAHLKEELDAGRIRGTDYANALSQLIIHAMGEATNYAIAKVKLAAELKDLAVETATKQFSLDNILPKEANNLVLSGEQIAAQTKQTVQQTVNLITDELLTRAQIKDTEITIGTKEYQLLNILPKEADNLVLGGLQIGAQTKQNVQQTENLITQNILTKAQIDDVVLGTQIKDYQLLNFMPKEADNLSLTGIQIAAQTKQTVQQTRNLVSTDLLTHAQITDTETTTSIKQYQLTHVLPEEVSNLKLTGLQTKATTTQTNQQTTNLVTEELRVKAETSAVLKEIELKEYQLTFLLPEELLLNKAKVLLASEELALAKENIKVRQEELATLQYQLLNRLPVEIQQLEAQISNVTKETEIKSYQLLNLLPLEIDKVTAETAAISTQSANVEADTAIKSYQLTVGLPKDTELKVAQLAIASEELLLKKEQLLQAAQDTLIKTKQLALTEYELLHKLPADVDLIKSQDALYTQKTITEKAQTDKTVIGTGSYIDVNCLLLEAQAKNMKTSSEQAAAKILIDTWNVRHTNDPEGNLENTANKLTDSNIGSLVSAMASGVGVTL